MPTTTARPITRRRAVVLDCTCQRCGHAWTVLGPEPPRACSRCKAIGWQRPAGAVPMGRPPIARE